MPDIIVMRILRDTIFNISLRDHAFWIFFGESASAEQIPFPSAGCVWDLGSNIGLHSVAAAKSGCRVIAFDIAEINILCLRQTAAQNGLTITAVLSPITVRPVKFIPAKTAHTEEKLTLGGTRQSLDFNDAARIYGLPDFIKIDIEGSEAELLASKDFRNWIFENHIQIYLELHDGCESLLWPEFKRVDKTHWLLKSNESSSATGGATTTERK